MVFRLKGFIEFCSANEILRIMKALYKGLFVFYLLIQVGANSALGNDADKSVVSKDQKVIADINEIESDPVKISILLASMVVIGSVVIIGRKTWREERTQS